MSGRTVPEILRESATLFERKANDYAPNPERPFQNFEEAAAFASDASGKKLTREDVCLALIGVKVSRIRTLGTRKADNEPLTDTVRDLMIYSGIFLAMRVEAPVEPKKEEKP